MTSARGFAESQPFEGAELRSVRHTRLKIDNAGRILIPAEMRAAMMVAPGETVTAEVIDGEFRIISPDVALKRVQAFAKEFRAKNPGADQSARSSRRWQGRYDPPPTSSRPISQRRISLVPAPIS